MASSSDIVALIQLVFYIAALGAVVLLVRRHGYRGENSWVAVCAPAFVFVSIRISSSILHLAAALPGKSHLSQAAAILDNVGLAPLLLVLAGTIKRSNATLVRGLRPWLIMILQVSSILATILGATGGRKVYAGEAEGGGNGVALMRAGSFILVVVFVIIVVLSAVTYTIARRECARVESGAMVWVAACMPAMLVRVAYLLLALYWTADDTFRPLGTSNGSVWTHFAMSTVSEAETLEFILAYALSCPKADYARMDDDGESLK
ncbi:hypothetical protein F4778DRAFT_747305 [Xylariomycetidae sp. FL2044]|nr:hypothetical protein F4778DRAFT_747305 [Xylariomycetidae sp. FL2044]